MKTTSTVLIPLVTLLVSSCGSFQKNNLAPNEQQSEYIQQTVTPERDKSENTVNLYLSKGYSKNLTSSDALKKLKHSLQGIDSDESLLLMIFGVGSQAAPQLIGTIPIEKSNYNADHSSGVTDDSPMIWQPPNR